MFPILAQLIRAISVLLEMNDLKNETSQHAEDTGRQDFSPGVWRGAQFAHKAKHTLRIPKV